MFRTSQKILILRHFSTKIKFLKKPINEHVTSVFQKHEKYILYSSFFEDHYLKLGYKKSKILQEMLKMKEEQIKISSIKVKPLPVALKYIASEEEQMNYEEITSDESTKIVFTKEEEKFLESLREHEIMEHEKNIPVEENEKEYPNWLHDYEHFNEDDKESDVRYGTPDPSIPVSKIPCNGCGALLQCAEPSLSGYLPSEIYKSRTNIELKNIICQRCHFLKNYNTALNISVKPEEYLQMISAISHKPGLAILIVDLLDFPTSIWSDVHTILGVNRPLFIVGNKVDLIPKDCRNYVNNIKQRLTEEVLKKGILQQNIKHIALVSATTGYGIEELITHLHHKWGSNGDVYLIGATNVGKSSLFNALLRSDYCKIQAQDLVKRATASPWPGTTLRLLKFPILRPSHYRVFLRTQRIISQQYIRGQEEKLRKIQANKTGKVEYATLIGHIGQSFKPEPQEALDSFSLGKPNIEAQALNEDSKIYRESKWCYDTPGVILPDQIHHKLNIQEILLANPKEMMRPRTFYMKPGLSLFVAGLARIDYTSGKEPIRLLVYTSLQLPILICDTVKSEEIYSDLLPTDAFQVPQNIMERSQPWQSLECIDDNYILSGKHMSITVADIVLSSIGWIGVNPGRDETITLKVWSPNGKGVFLRQPALLAQGFRLRGKRIRDSLAYKTGKAFIKQ